MVEHEQASLQDVQGRIDTIQKSHTQAVWGAIIGGILGLAIAMGVGRFAYTPLLPLMQREYGFGDSVAGGLAAVNYAGYLLGALACMLVPLGSRRMLLFRICIVLNIGTTAAMGLPVALALWWGIRLVAGVASAGMFVIGSALVLDRLSRHHATGLKGIIYSGVGLGITLTGVVVLLFAGMLDTRGIWLGLALLCLPLAVASWRWVVDDAADEQSVPVGSAVRDQTARQPLPPLLTWLTLAYFCEGLGYIVSGTFLVAIVQEHTAGSAGTTTWIITGVAAAVSTLLWPLVAVRSGTVRTLIAAHLAQAVGIALPVIAHGVAAAYAGALLFGGTFMGITALSITLGQSLAPHQSARVIGLLTAAYGAGQIIGPALAGVLAERTDSFVLPLVGASAVVALGAVLLAIGSQQAELRQYRTTTTERVEHRTFEQSID